jgi:hypothetical protein
MRKLTISFCMAAILLACNNDTKKEAADTKVAGVSTEATPKADEWVPVDDSTAMKAMMEAGTPGPEHAMLAKWAGNWKAETKMWMAPDAKPETSTAQVTNKMLMGGRYQQSNWKGEMMGGPFEGTSTTAYDKAKKKWVSTWIDSWSTGMMQMEGDWDEANKTITYTGQMLCPANGKMCEMKEKFTIVDDNTQTMEMWGPDMKTGKMFKNMEMKLTRVQ